MTQVAFGIVSQEEQVAAVREYAERNYDKGWDIIVEATDDDEILDLIKGAKTRWGAIDKVGKYVRTYTSYARDIQGA